MTEGPFTQQLRMTVLIIAALGLVYWAVIIGGTQLPLRIVTVMGFGIVVLCALTIINIMRNIDVMIRDQWAGWLILGIAAAAVSATWKAGLSDQPITTYGDVVQEFYRPRGDNDVTIMYQLALYCVAMSVATFLYKKNQRSI